ncbi:unnamed protein product [Hapterophycus canaliculatus]
MVATGVDGFVGCCAFLSRVGTKYCSGGSLVFVSSIESVFPSYSRAAAFGSRRFPESGKTGSRQTVEPGEQNRLAPGGTSTNQRSCPWQKQTAFLFPRVVAPRSLFF